jgi:multidrug efflux pump subunit AcrB
MRIWLDPAKLNNYGLTPVDVSNAIQAQNAQIASGELGGLGDRSQRARRFCERGNLPDNPV